MAEIKLVDTQEVFVGKNQEKIEIQTFSLSLNGLTVHVSNVGASVTKLLVPNFSGSSHKVDDVVLGYKSPLDIYKCRNPPYLAVIVGRVANRISRGRFALDGQDYILDTNNGPNHLHGGQDGFSHRVWKAKQVKNRVEFTLFSPDGDQGYPGSVQVKAVYSLVPPSNGSKGATLTLHMEGKLMSEETPSPLNLANHSYFNLAGHDNPAGILEHSLTMACEAYTPVDSTYIPTRDVKSLDEDSVMDWRKQRAIKDALVDYGTSKAGLSQEEVQKHFELSRCAPNLAVAGKNCQNPHEPYGFDHNYVIHHPKSKDSQEISLVGILDHALSGRRLMVFTDAPGVQLYTGNWLDGSNSDVLKDGATYGQWQGLCLETQSYPDAIISGESKESFYKGKCCVLRPGGPDYKHSVEYHFVSIPDK
eukprot:CAMPEP_0194226326 /NCGR_PEP_ID=MMETSP0156-20130528/41631_1 /TAXON_ID=33649 /ORGANISM="Thalassionema nitzschioides, Strain L26-B" /LENGTH=417 /DNA_ID=CAMNT_0038958649 /DNA_START=53 /DNA_END=1303 /DNA_ORIENTATION=+